MNCFSSELRAVALALCGGHATPTKELVKSFIKEERWDELVALKVDPSSYSSAYAYLDDVAAWSLLRKYEPLPTKVDRKKAALESFWKSEHGCYRTNERLSPFVYGSHAVSDESMYVFIELCRKKVIELVGTNIPSRDGRFGPGATYGDRGSLTTIPDKMQTSVSLTPAAWPFLVPWTGTLWARAAANRDESFSFERGNRFTTVPKDCTKDRGISVEPSVNLFYQLGVGNTLRERLKARVGLDLRVAQDIHRRVACEASISGDFATIDLSSASDTIAYNLVKLLLPHAIFDVLDALRSSFTLLPSEEADHWVKLEKFSSMGNGYTFELETIVFLAIAMAVMETLNIQPKVGVNVFVFGDDIIVPTSTAEVLIAALAFFGMSTNKDKTFIKGPFRESCGGDFFGGLNVRPYFQKKEPNEPHELIAMVNGIRRLSHHDCSRPHILPNFHRAWLRGRDFLPSHIRDCVGPEALGDLCLHDEESRWNTRVRSSIRYVRVYKPAQHREVKWCSFDEDVILAGRLYGVGRTERVITCEKDRIRDKIPDSFKPRDSVSGYSLGWIPYS